MQNRVGDCTTAISRPMWHRDTSTQSKGTLKGIRRPRDFCYKNTRLARCMFIACQLADLNYDLII